jgi:hypothetical protein
MPTLKILFVGSRRFEKYPRIVPAWTWENMKEYPSIDAQRTPTAHRRLVAAGFLNSESVQCTAVDLLPPGIDWDFVAATKQAIWLEAHAFHKLSFDAIVLFGGRVAAAFDVEGLYKPDGGVVVVPSPHPQKVTDWDTSEGRLRIVDAVTRAVAGE